MADKKDVAKKLVKRPEVFVTVGEILIGAGRALNKIGSSLLAKGEDGLPGKTISTEGD